MVDPAIRDAIAPLLKVALHQKIRQGRRLTPTVICALVASAALVPIALSGGAALSLSGPLIALFGGIGTDYLGEWLQQFLKRVGDPQRLDEGELREQLEQALFGELQKSGDGVAALRADISRLMQRIDAVDLTLAQAPTELQQQLVAGFLELGRQLDEFRWLLDELLQTLETVRDRQTTQLAMQREQLDQGRLLTAQVTLLLQMVQTASINGAPEHPNGAVVDAEDTPPADIPCPYKGLAPFGTEDAALFFGREQLVANLVARLAEKNVLAIAGASGSGKSSLVRAGLLAALQTNALPGSAQWPVVVFKPGSRPVEALAEAFAVLAGLPVGALQRELVRDAHDSQQVGSELVRTARALLSNRPADSRLLLVVDQFEEVFTSGSDEQAEHQRGMLLDMLLRMVNEPTARTSLVLTMRDDFYGACAAYPELNKAVTANTVLVGPMTTDELCAVIECPARQVGLRLEPGLVEHILLEIGDAPGMLPLLSHTLAETWERRRGRTLTRSGYREAGGVREALKETAQTVYDQLTSEQQELGRSIALRLTQPTDDPSRFTARRARRGEILRLRPQAPEQVDLVLRRLEDARLIIGTEKTVELAHEALIEAWPALNDWLKKNSSDRRIAHELTEAAQRWDEAGDDRGHDHLYRGSLLARAQEWATEHPGELNELEASFLQASDDAAKSAERAEIERLAALAAAEKKAADAAKQAADAANDVVMAQRRRNRWLRGFVLTLSGSLFAMVIGCGVVVLLAVGVRQARDQARQQEQIAKDQAEKAKQQEQIAFTRRLAAQVVADEGTDIDTSLLLGLEASRLGQTRDVQGGVMAGLVNTARLKTSLRGHFSEVSAVAFNPAGTLLASAGADHQVLIWDAKTYTLLHTLIGHTDQVFQVTFSPTDPTTLISVGDDSTIRLWNAATGEVQQHFSYTGSLSDIAVSSDGKRVVGVGCAEHDAQKVCSKGKVSLWQLGGDTSPQTLTGGESLLREVAFNPAKPDELVTGGDDGSVLLWNLSDGSSKPYAYTNYTSPIYAVAFSPNGLHIAWANRSGTLFIRSLETDVATVALPPIQASTTSILSIAFSADGNQVASTGYDRSIQFWRVADGQKLQTLSVVHGAAIDALAFSSDGSMLASASRDHTVRIWNMRGAYDYGVGQELGGYARSELAFNADGSRLAIGNWQEVALWNGQTLQPLNQSLKGHTAWVEAVAFNPAPDRAELLAAGGADGELFIWNTINNTVQYTLTRHQVEIRRVAFAPDGRQLVSADESGKVLLWDVDSGMLLRELQGHRDYVGSLAFSADGLLLASGSCGQRRADRSCSQGEIRVWRLVDGQQLGEPLANHTDWVNDLAFAPNAPILASGSRDKSVMLWDVAPDGTIRLRDVLNGHTNTVLNVQFTPDGQRLASGGWDRVIKLWRVSDGTLEQELPAKHQSPVLNLVFRPGSDELITTGQAGEMLRWRYTAEQEQPEAIFAGDDLYTVYAVAFSPHPKHGLLASAGRDWNVNFWNAQTGQWRYALKHQAPVRAVAFSSDGKQLVSGSEDYSVRLWNIDYDNFYNSSEVLSMTTHTNWVLSVAFSPDNTLIASGSADDSVILWRAENGEVVHHFDDISGYGDINSVAFSPDGALLAAGTDFGNILIWNVATKERVARLSGHDNAVLTLAFNPEQPTMLASGGLDGIVTIWDVARKRRDGVVLNGHTDSVFSVVFNQAGTMLATGSRDRSIALWDIATRQIIGTRLEGHRDVVRSLAFSSDDNMLVSGAELSPIMVWNVGTDWWRAEACRRAGRSLTWNEWQQYMGDEPYRATCPDTALPLSQQIVQAHTHAQAGDGVRAREMFATISTAVVQLASPLLNNQVCWQGALSDAAEVVLPACDKAVALAQQLELSAAWYQDSRGVARALAGDLAGARADFEAYVQWTQSQEDNGSYEQQGRRREQWIKIIDEEQRNPIDAETLADLEFDRLGDWLPDNQYGASR